MAERSRQPTAPPRAEVARPHTTLAPLQAKLTQPCIAPPPAVMDRARRTAVACQAGARRAAVGPAHRRMDGERWRSDRNEVGQTRPFILAESI